MTGPLFAGLLAGYGIAVPVGAVASYLVGLAARTSWRVGAAGGLGVATDDGMYALVAVLGGDGLAGAIEPVAAPLRLLSAAVLMLVAAQVARSGVRASRRVATDRSDPAPVAAAQAYRRLVAVTMVNPTTVVYFAALVAGAAELAADRCRAARHRDRDRPDPVPGPMQIGDPDPLVLGQVPRRNLPLATVDHRRIVQPPAIAAGDCPAVSPAFPGPRIDTDDPTRLGVRDAAGNQPSSGSTQRRWGRASPLPGE